MIEKLTVIFFVLLFLIVGIILIVFPWVDFGIISWNDNYLLNLASEKTGLTFLQPAVGSGWFRGAVSGLGILNLFFAFWEMAHFNRSVKMLESKEK